MFSLLLSHGPTFQCISAGSEESRYNLLDMLKSPNVVSVEIYLPKATHSDPSSPPSFCLYPSTKVVPVKKDSSVSLILFSFPAIHTATLNMKKWDKMYPFSTLNPHSILILSLSTDTPL